MKSQNFFQKAFQDPIFKKNLLEAKETIRETSLETGFVVGRKYTEGFYMKKTASDYEISKVQLSDDDNKLEGRTWIDGPIDGLFDCIDLHFHSKFYMPSVEDIKFLNYSKKWNYEDFKIESSPLMVVASYTPKKTSLFLLQEKPRELIGNEKLDNIIDAYEDLIIEPTIIKGKPVEPKKTIDFFNFTNLYKCDIINFTDSANMGKNSLDKLAKFDDYLKSDEEFNENYRKDEESRLRKFQEENYKRKD